MRRPIAAATVVAALALGAAPATAATVTSAADDGGPGTLRVLLANAGANEVIVLPDPTTLAVPATTYTLTGGQLTVTNKEVTVQGAGARKVTIDAGGTGRAFRVSYGGTFTSLTLTGVTVTNARNTSAIEPFGGAIYASGSVGQSLLNIADSAFVGNAVDAAAANGFGGAIGASGQLNITRTLFTGNTAYNRSNGLSSFGGAIWVGGTSQITSSTIYDNAVELVTTGSVNGGGIATSGTGTASVFASTVAANRVVGAGGQGGNLSATAGQINVGQSIVADGVAADAAAGNCAGTVTDVNNNVFGQAGGCAVGGGSLTASPLLDSALRDNGGPADSLRVLPGSPAIDRIDPSACVALNKDQRGFPRSAGPKCEAGAYEASPPVVTGPAASAVTGATAHLDAQVQPNGHAGAIHVAYGTAADALTSTTPGTALAKGDVPVATAADLTGLEPNRTYFYAFVATNPDGAGRSDVASFRTASVAPGVTTGPATGITATSATIAGTVDPRGTATEYRFEIGTSPATLTPLTTRLGGDGRGATAQAETVAGLVPDTQYSFRVVATNAAGRSESAIGTFRTTANGTGPGGGATALKVSSLKLSPSSLKRGKGATISFTLAGGPATVTFTVQTTKPGRRSGRKCVAPPRRGRFKRCTRTVTLKGSFRTTGKDGANTVAWNGKVGGRRLAKGSYTLVAVATTATGKSGPVRVAFRAR